ncbi:MAG TPA: hypothetical protein VFJ90_09595, partial [Candidatus Didemnitutus sp.]|nr:hypothetical protein [Candidatus Didemnitutus sp.]
ETPLQTATRLLAAFEDLVEREATAMSEYDLAGALGVAERLGPIVDRLVSLAAEPEVGSLRPRVQALLARRRQTEQHIDTQLVRLRTELGQISRARVRISRVAPVYGRAVISAESRLNAAV